MKIIWGSVLSIFFSSLLCFAQGQTSVNKFPGEDFFIKLTFPTTVTVGGFDVIQKAKGASTVESVVQVLANSDRQTTGLKAPLLGGQYYYTVRVWMNISSGGVIKKVYGQDWNEVTMTVYVLPIGTAAIQ